MLCFRPINTLVVIQVWNDLFIWILLVYISQTYIKTAAWLSRTLSFCLDTCCRILSSELQLSRCQRGPLYFQTPQQYSENLPQRHGETQPGVRFKPHEQTEALKPFLSIAAHEGKKWKHSTGSCVECGVGNLSEAFWLTRKWPSFSPIVSNPERNKKCFIQLLFIWPPPQN